MSNAPALGSVIYKSGFKNKIINGKMTVAQRGTSFAAIATGAYSIDRWAYTNTSAAVQTASQQGDGPSNDEFINSLRFAVTTADTSIAAGDVAVIDQRIEGYNARDLVGRTFALSFWVRSSKTGIHCVSFRNSAADRSFVLEYSVSAANTWEKKIVSVPGGLITSGTWDWANGIGLFVGFTLAAGATYQTTTGAWQTGNLVATSNQVNCLDTIGNIFAITGVQLEVGTASEFDHRPYVLEEMLCKRYYEAQAAFRTLGFACPSTGGFAHIFDIKWCVQKRAVPTCGWTIGSLNNVASYSTQTQSVDSMTVQIVGSILANTTFTVSNVSASAEL